MKKKVNNLKNESKTFENLCKNLKKKQSKSIKRTKTKKKMKNR